MTSLFRTVQLVALLNVALLLTAASLSAQSDTSPPAKVVEYDADKQTGSDNKPEAEIDAATKELHDKFEKNLTNTKFVGQFTITGMNDPEPRKEEYTITKVEKLPKGDYWRITARIKYGEHDVTVPMAMEVKWAGKTPVITVDRLFVPGLGTFDARVLLRKDKYAGTWAHGKVGGHLFGRIEKNKTVPDGATEN